MVAVVVEDRRYAVPDHVDAALVMSGRVARVDDDPVLVVEPSDQIVLQEHGCAPVESTVLRDVDCNSAAQAVVVVEVEDQRVRVDEVVRAERDDCIARALEHAALTGIRGQAR